MTCKVMYVLQMKAAEQVVLAACHLSLTALCFAYFAFDLAHTVHKETLVQSHHIIQSICNFICFVRRYSGLCFHSLI